MEKEEFDKFKGRIFNQMAEWDALRKRSAELTELAKKYGGVVYIVHNSIYCDLPEEHWKAFMVEVTEMKLL